MEQFEVIFYDEFGENILERKLVNKGESTAFTGKEPEKDMVNGIKYVFVGWVNEEKLNSVEENLYLFAKFEEDTSKDMEDVLFEATLEQAKKTDLNSTIAAGNKLTDQKRALEKDSRTPEEIVEEVLKNGKAEIGEDLNKDDVER